MVGKCTNPEYNFASCNKIMVAFHRISRILGLVAIASLSSAAFAQRGAITAPRNLAQLTDGAAVIVRGSVVSATFEPHPQLHSLKTVVVNVKVRETLKGTAPSVYTFRQFIWDIRDRYNTAGYRKGQDVLLLMNSPNQLGLTSPVGLDQGRFRITRDARGAALATNGHANAGLFRDMQPQLRQRKIQVSTPASRMIQQDHGPVRVEELTEVIRALVTKR